MAQARKLHFTRKTLIIGTVLALVLAGGGVLAYQQTRSDNNPQQVSENPESTTQNDDEINLDPPTEQEKKETEQHKDDLAKQNEQQPGGNTKATVTIIDASQYGQTIEVRAMISGVYEDGGTCKATFTQGSASLSKQSTGFKDATTTTCIPMTITRSDFPSAGDWTVVVTYTSAAANGTSGSKTMRVQ
jgi:hypothetical protein